MKAEDTEALWR